MIKNRSGVSHYILLFLGGALLYIAAVLPFLIYHEGIFFYYGDYNVQQVPFYILAHRAVRSGSFFWNPYIDLGSSMGGSMSFYLWGSPFFWLTIPFPEKAIPYILPFVMSLRKGRSGTGHGRWSEAFSTRFPASRPAISYSSIFTTPPLSFRYTFSHSTRSSRSGDRTVLR